MTPGEIPVTMHDERRTAMAAAAKSLELPKVLNRLAQAALSQPATEQLLALRPLTDLTLIQRAQAETSEMRALLDFDDAFPIEEFPDVRPAISQLRVQGRALAVRQLLDLTVLAVGVRLVRRYLDSRQEKYPLLSEQALRLTVMQEVERAIETAIDFKDGSVKDSASPVLGRLRRDLKRAHNDARARLEKTLKSLAARDMLQEQVITLREGRLVLMLKGEFRNRVEGIVHDESASGRTAFVEPLACVALNNQIRRLEAEERNEIERILFDLSERFRQVLPALEINLEVMTHLDVVHAKARFSQQQAAQAPQMTGAPQLRLLNARHPLLILRSQEEGDKQLTTVVPLNLTLGRGDDDEHNVYTLLISGPNAGGKTVALKTAGLLSLMAHCGLHIPASADSIIPLLKNVFVDIGDRQSIEDDLSTFTSHVAHLEEIVRQARAGDMVLIDEIGSGTDPDAGVALAMAVLQELTGRACLSIVTTHHGALKSFADAEAGVANGSMAFDNEQLTPTYQFRAGIPGASYAFEIAERMGLPPELIASARQNLGSDRHNVEKLIADLQARLSEQQTLNQQLQLERTRLAGLEKLYAERSADLKQREAELRRKAVSEAEKLVHDANAVIENTVREIREQQASKDSIRAAQEELRDLRQRLIIERQQLGPRREPGNDKAPVTEIQEGQSVWWIKQNALAEVLTQPDSAGKVLIGMGSLRARVPVNELRAAQESPPSAPISFSRTQLEDTTRSFEIDLRGLRVDEALATVDKFLDNAILAGWDEVRLIHGKGTGALRESISEYLKKDSKIKRFQTAGYGEGDYGVTIVELA